MYTRCNSRCKEYKDKCDWKSVGPGFWGGLPAEGPVRSRQRGELVWGQSLILSLIEFGLFTELQRSGCVQLASGGGA